jgi:hypothetical protein
MIGFAALLHLLCAKKHHHSQSWKMAAALSLVGFPSC